jgi:protein ImuB
LARRWRHEGRLSTLALAERVRWQLHAWLHAGDLGADPDAEAGIVRLALVLHRLTPATGQQALLWGDAHREEIEGAAARFGPGGHGRSAAASCSRRLAERTRPTRGGS